MSSLDALLVWLDSGVCSQIPSHSFWPAGRQLPLCARDLGLFGAFLLTLPFVHRSRRVAWLLGLAPLILDGANSFGFETLNLSLYQPSNALRLATGAMAGLCLAHVVPLPSQWERLGEGTLAVGIAATFALAIDSNLALALLGTAGVIALIATANLLTKPAMSRHLAWALALPELALLATAKHSLLALIR